MEKARAAEVDRTSAAADAAAAATTTVSDMVTDTAHVETVHNLHANDVRAALEENELKNYEAEEPRESD
jgi:hypothetical protein